MKYRASIPAPLPALSPLAAEPLELLDHGPFLPVTVNGVITTDSRGRSVWLERRQ